jgi:hypothetical protein
MHITIKRKYSATLTQAIQYNNNKIIVIIRATAHSGLKRYFRRSKVLFQNVFKKNKCQNSIVICSLVQI